MELLNRSIRAFKGISDDPKLPAYQKDALDASNESEENDRNQQSSSQKGQSEIMENAGEDIVIEFGQDDRNQPPVSPQNVAQQEIVEEVEEDAEYSDLEYRKTIENIIQIVLYSVLKWSTVIGFICIILTITLRWRLPCLYVLLFICLVEMYSLLNTIRNLIKSNPEEKHRQRVKVLQALLSTAAKASLLFYNYIKPFPLVYAFAPTLTFDIIFALFLIIKYYNRPARGYYTIRFLLTAFYIVLVSSVALKMDGFIPWHWREVFMSYWALLGITVGVTIVTILVFLNKFLSFFLVDRQNYEFYGILWLGLFFAGSSALSCLFTYKLQKVLENELEPKALLPFLILSGVYCIGFTMFTTTNFKKLEIFFTKFCVIDEEFPAVASPMAQNEEKQKPSSPKKLVIPRFLTKSSNTYFRKVTQNDIEQSKQRMKRLKEKASKIKVKQPRQRQNSFDQAMNKNTWIRNFAMNQNPDLLTIPETDRDKLRTEVLMTGRSTTRYDIKPLNLYKKTSEGAFTSQPTDRSRAGLMGSHRSTVNYEKDYNDTDKIDSYRNLPEGILGHLTPENTSRITEHEHDDEEKADDGFSLFLEDIRPLSARRANSLNALPGPMQAGLQLITESEANKENSRLEASELMTSTLDASGVQQCLICFDKQPDAVFMDCGHGGVCYECSLEIWKTTMECYLCRKKINQVLQIDPKNKIGKHIIKVVSATQMVMCDNNNNNKNQNENSSASVQS